MNYGTELNGVLLIGDNNMKPFKFFKSNIDEFGPFVMEHYNVGDTFTFIGVGPILFEPFTFSSQRYMYYRGINGRVIRGELISEDHPAFTYAPLFRQ